MRFRPPGAWAFSAPRSVGAHNIQSLTGHKRGSRGLAGLPRNIRELGYTDKWIEWTFSNQDMESVCPDLIVASEKMGHTLLLEFKSGANTEPYQLRRYSRVNQNDITVRAFISRNATHNYDISVIGKSEHGERLLIGISDGGYQFPLLLKDQDGLYLDHNQFRIRQLNSLFSPELEIDWAQVPSRFVPIDKDSELWEVAEVVIPQILRYMTQRRPLVKVEDICQDEHVCVTWSLMGKPAKSEFRSKIQEVLTEAIRQHFRLYLRWMKRGDSIQILNNPLELQSDKRTSAYRKLRTAQKDFIESLKTGGGQLQLPLDTSNAD